MPIEWYIQWAHQRFKWVRKEELALGLRDQIVSMEKNSWALDWNSSRHITKGGCKRTYRGRIIKINVIFRGGKTQNLTDGRYQWDLCSWGWGRSLSSEGKGPARSEGWMGKSLRDSRNKELEAVSCVSERAKPYDNLINQKVDWGQRSDSSTEHMPSAPSPICSLPSPVMPHCGPGENWARPHITASDPRSPTPAGRSFYQTLF